VLGVALLTLLFTAGSFLAPVLMGSGRSWAGLLHFAYAPVCHQLPERCLSVGDGVQAVCARCSGLYLGAVAGLIAGAFFLVGRRSAPRPFWLGLVALPTLIDALLPWIGLPGLPNLPRLLLAWPVGFVAALFVARGIEEIVAARPRSPGGEVRPRNERDENRIARRTGRESLEVVDG
jgi:uncharacterized membrane protein